MGFLQKIFNKTTIASVGDWNTWGTNTTAGQNVTIENSLNLSSVYACINVKANALAKQPLQVFRTGNKGKERVTDHQVARLLSERPNAYMTPFMFFHTAQVHRNTHGVVYIRKQYVGTRLDSLHFLHPPSVTPVMVTDPDTKEQKMFYVENGVNGQNTYDEDEIIRVMYMSLDGINPKSPIRVARETIGTMKAQNKFLSSFYSNGTLTRGVLEVATTLNKDAKDKIRQHWEEANTGEANASKVAVLDSGMQFKNITLPLQDAEFIASMKFGMQDICRIFNVPPHMVGDLERATFSNIEHQAMQFVTEVMLPDAISFEQELNRKLFTEKERRSGYYVKFNFASALRGDNASRGNLYKVMLEMGVLSINEVRELEEKEAIENGDKHLISLNHTTLDNLEHYQNNKNAPQGGE